MAPLLSNKNIDFKEAGIVSIVSELWLQSISILAETSRPISLLDVNTSVLCG